MKILEEMKYDEIILLTEMREQCLLKMKKNQGEKNEDTY